MPAEGFTAIFVTILAIALAAFTQGFSGFGIGLVAMGLMTLVTSNAERATVLVSAIALITMGSLLALARGEMKIDWRSAGLLMLGIAPGFALGFLAVESFGCSPWFGAAIGVSLVSFGLHGMFAKRATKPMPAWSAVPMGALGGVLIGALTSGGPPLVMYLYSRKADPRAAKGTLQAIFLTTGVTRLALVHAAGKPIDGPMWAWIAGLGVVAAAMAVLGHRLSKRLTAASFARVVYALIAATGLMNVTKAALVLC